MMPERLTAVRHERFPCLLARWHAVLLMLALGACIDSSRDGTPGVVRRLQVDAGAKHEAPRPAELRLSADDPEVLAGSRMFVTADVFDQHGRALADVEVHFELSACTVDPCPNDERLSPENVLTEVPGGARTEYQAGSHAGVVRIDAQLKDEPAIQQSLILRVEP
jgi:hypothetical protein